MSRPSLPRGENGPFEHLREQLGFADDHFSGKYAQVFWHKHPEDRTSYDVSVCFVPRNTPDFDFMNNRNEAFGEICRNAFCDYGNSVHGWTGGGDELARLFGSIADFGFSDHAEFVRAVDEFSRLTEADWARAMRRGMRGSFQEDDEEC